MLLRGLQCFFCPTALLAAAIQTTAIELATRAIRVPADALQAVEAIGTSGAASGASTGPAASAVGAALGGGIRTAFQVEFVLVDTPGSTIFNQREAGMKIVRGAPALCTHAIGCGRRG